MISERDLTDLCFAGLRPSIRDKLEHYEFVNVNQLLQRVISAESRLKESHETYKSNRHNVHVVDDYSDCSDDDNKEICPAEIKWPAENKMVTVDVGCGPNHTSERALDARAATYRRT
jgi:hypothetical protein